MLYEVITAEALCLVLEKGVPGRTYNIGGARIAAVLAGLAERIQVVARLEQKRLGRNNFV